MKSQGKGDDLCWLGRIYQGMNETKLKTHQVHDLNK